MTGTDSLFATPPGGGPVLRPGVLPFPFVPEQTVVDGRFLVKGELGQGGMGRCYRVVQTSLDRECVLKMLAPKLHPRFVPHRDARVLLENEAKTLGLLAQNSDAFVQVFDRGVALVAVQQKGAWLELDLPYYTMELLCGQSLEAVIEYQKAERRFLPWSMVLKLSAQAARALSIAHAKGVVHRDIKPDNLFLHERIDHSPVVRFIDFGVSTREGDRSVLGTGTLRYGSPELLGSRSDRESTQSDIYPLCLVIYEIAALRGPFVGASKQDYLHAHLHVPAPPLSQSRGDAPPALTKVLAAGLEKRPEDRPTARELADALDALRQSTDGGGAADAQIADLLAGLARRSRQRPGPRRSSSAGRNHATTASGAASAESQAFAVRAPIVVVPPGVPAGVAARPENATKLFGAQADLPRQDAPAATVKARTTLRMGTYADRVPALRAPEATAPFGLGAPTQPSALDPSAMAAAFSSPVEIRDAPSSSSGPERADTAPDASALLDRTDPLAFAPEPDEASADDAQTGSLTREADEAVPGVLTSPIVVVGAPTPLFDDIEVPVYRSMAQMFDAIWDDDTRYLPSPFDSGPAVSSPPMKTADPRRGAPTVKVSPVPARPESTREPLGVAGGAPALATRFASNAPPPRAPASRRRGPVVAIIGCASGGVLVGAFVGWWILSAHGHAAAAPGTPKDMPAAVAPPAPAGVGSAAQPLAHEPAIHPDARSGTADR